MRVYDRQLVDALRARGFDDFSPAFPSVLSNLDTDGTRIGVIALRAGVTRQAAGQLLRQIESCGYVEFRYAPDDARATMVHFTARWKRLLATVLELVERLKTTLPRRSNPANSIAFVTASSESPSASIPMVPLAPMTVTRSAVR